MLLFLTTWTLVSAWASVALDCSGESYTQEGVSTFHRRYDFDHSSQVFHEEGEWIRPGAISLAMPRGAPQLSFHVKDRFRSTLTAPHVQALAHYFIDKTSYYMAGFECRRKPSGRVLAGAAQLSVSCMIEAGAGEPIEQNFVLGRSETRTLLNIGGAQYRVVNAHSARPEGVYAAFETEHLEYVHGARVTLADSQELEVQVDFDPVPRIRCKLLPIF